jgi:hypothetical protein
MPEDSRPELTIEATEAAAAEREAIEAAPLAIPPGCSIPVANMALEPRSPVRAPLAPPPSADGSAGASGTDGPPAHFLRTN